MPQAPLFSPIPTRAPPEQVGIAGTGLEAESPVGFAPAGGSAVAISAAHAHAALAHWQWAVRGLPFTVPADDARIALRGLAAWYCRIFADDTFDNPAPADGIDALLALESARDSYLDRRVVVAHWTVRVAQELAECRRRGLGGDSDRDATFVALAKLDLALQGALDRLG